MNVCAKCGEYIPDGHACVGRTSDPPEYYHNGCYFGGIKCPACNTEVYKSIQPYVEQDEAIYHKSCFTGADQQESFNDFKIKQLVDRKDLMVKYLNLKVSEEDWHGVQDAASDLRDLQVELDTRKDLRNENHN